MFYQDRFTNGRLFCRTSPDGEWVPAVGPVADAVNALLGVSREDRLEIFARFCSSCGRSDPKCQCWNDE
jgi:hypothetical protein